MNKFVCKLCLVISVMPFIQNYLSAQIQDMPDNPDPNGCYAKMLVPDTYETWTEEFPIYIGEEYQEDNLEIIDLEVINKRTIWIEMEIKGTPTWCLVEQEPVIEKLTIVKDTSLTVNYIWETFEITSYNAEGGFTEWQKVICHDQFTYSLVNQLENKLYSLGYYDEEFVGRINLKLSNAIAKFQRSNGLYSGSISYETLDKLGIVLLR